MRKSQLILVGMTMWIAGAGNVRAGNGECEKAAIDIARSIRTVEMPEQVRNAKFTVESAEVTEDYERYVVRMWVNGKQPMADQRLVMVGGATCILANYDMPGAG